MKTIEAVVGILKADQAPLICLDTCDFLDVVRGVAEGNLAHAESFRVILENFDVNSSPFRLLITYLTRHEWEQNKDQGRKVVEQFLEVTANSSRRIAQARKIGGLPALLREDGLFDSTLASRLTELAENVMNHAIVLEKEDSCVARALERVMMKRRPAHKNQIKDSIHWEHYLELSRHLRLAGHVPLRLFVSANKSDFWRKKDQPSLHPDLEQEATDAGLGFFGRLDAALQTIGVLRPNL
jgi:hypothetical protein